jgi:phosphatidylglycerophosphate synthase
MTHLSAAARSTPGSRQGETLGSILTVAALTAVLGGVLAQNAGWQGRYVMAGWLAYAALGCTVAIAASFRPAPARFGLANQVTLLRAGLVCLAGGALLASGQAPGISWSLAGLIAAALSLDAVDGWLARRLGLTSAFGARFDIEIDALLLLILALLLWQTGRVDAWVLAIGLLRYGFVLAGRIRPWLRTPLPPSRRRKAICVQQGVTLLICLLPPVTPTLAGVAAALALTTLVLSFARDIHWLARHAGTTSGGTLVEDA